MSGLRSSAGDAARRAFGFFGRGTIDKVHDGSQIQEVDMSLLKDEKKTKIERFQSYGLSTVPLKPTGSGAKRKAAEAIVAFLSGNRSHGVIIAQDDRRHRPKNLKEGETCVYDDQGQQVLVSRDGIRVKGGGKNLPVHVDVGSTHLEFTKEKIVLKAGGKTLTIDDSGFKFEGGAITHDDHAIDKTHKHKDTAPGGGLSGIPQ